MELFEPGLEGRDGLERLLQLGHGLFRRRSRLRKGLSAWDFPCNRLA
jgi:hypothetical protein